MNNSMNYHSILAPYLKSHIERRMALGLKCEQDKWIYKEFDEHMVSVKHDREYLAKEDYNLWYNRISIGSKTNTIYTKVSTIRRFLVFLSQQGHECYIPRMPKKHDTGFIPYIYSKDEMTAIFKAVDELRLKEHHAESIIIILPALIRLLYSTAIRISEALNIRMRDVDFDRHVILIVKTKNGSERLAPINDSMEAVLRQYLRYRSKLHFTSLLSPDSYLFVSSLGKLCTRSCVLRWFSKIRQAAGISYKGNHEGPRVHDLRHTACCHSLSNLASEGKDVYCSLPVMATFMGHKKVMNTEHYLRLTQEMYPELIRLDESVTASISTVILRTIFTDDDGEI